MNEGDLDNGLMALPVLISPVLHALLKCMGPVAYSAILLVLIGKLWMYT